MLKTVLFTHTDLDGAGCRIIFDLAHQHLGKNEYKIINSQNDGIDEDVEKFLDSGEYNENTVLCFADICASRSVLEKVAAKFKTVKIWDHHKTNMYGLEVFPDAEIIPEDAFGKMNSGTSLIYQYFSSLDNPPEYFKESAKNAKLLSLFAETVRSYDTFEWKKTENKDAKRLCMLFFLLGMERFSKNWIERLTKGSSSDLFMPYELDFIEAKIENEQQTIDQIKFEDLFRANVKGMEAAIMFTGTGANVSELSYQLLQKHPEVDLLISINYGAGIINYRTTKEDLDCGFYFAKPCGGGGHPRAAGNPIPKKLIEAAIWDIIYSIETPEEFKEITA